jgi:hypothetical protein
MEFDYKRFHIEAFCLEEGGHYYARAKIFLSAHEGAQAHEIKWSGDIGDYPDDRDAVEAAQRWAMQWCDGNDHGSVACWRDGPNDIDERPP